MSARGVAQRLGPIGRIETQLARDRVTIHADDQGLDALGLAGLLGCPLDSARKLAPADRHELGVGSVTEARDTEREVVQPGSVYEQQQDHRRAPGARNPRAESAGWIDDPPG